MVRQPPIRWDRPSLLPRQVAEQQGTLPGGYTVARHALTSSSHGCAKLFDERKQILTFGPYSRARRLMMKRVGMEGIYLGGWATSARGSLARIPVRT